MELFVLLEISPEEANHMVRIHPLRRFVLAAAALLLLAAVPAMAAADPVAPAPGQATPAMVPLRPYWEAAGGKVTWDGDTMSVTVILGSLTVNVKIGEAVAMVNGEAVPMGGKAELANSRTMVPLAFLAAVTPVPVHWDPATGMATANKLDLTALGFVQGLVQGTAGDMVKEFSATFTALMPPARFAAIAKALTPYGALTKLQVAGRTASAVHENVAVIAVFAAVGPTQFTVRFSPDGKLDEYRFGAVDGLVSVAGSPAYAKLDSFTEREVVVGEAPWQLPGTLTLPTGKGPFPAVVLVHGSGPNDRDETVGGVKPFRDLAYGLASKGIAVLRYDKRTFEHGIKFSSDPRLGAQEETIDDAVKAVALLKRTEGIDPKRIFVLGHSQGGYFMPRIVAKVGQDQLKGAILMAGPNSFLDIFAEQHKLLADMGALPAPQAQAMIAQIEMLRDPAFDPANPPKGFALGMPAYWADFREDAAVLAKTQTTPMLLLQGARDYQVQASQLQSWKDELGGREKVTYNLYEKLNHIFTEGEGPLSSPQEYMTPANMPAYVIDDISTWVLKQ
jgi:uncharacterized protein